MTDLRVEAIRQLQRAAIQRDQAGWSAADLLAHMLDDGPAQAALRQGLGAEWEEYCCVLAARNRAAGGDWTT